MSSLSTASPRHVRYLARDDRAAWRPQFRPHRNLIPPCNVQTAVLQRFRGVCPHKARLGEVKTSVRGEPPLVQSNRNPRTGEVKPPYWGQRRSKQGATAPRARGIRIISRQICRDAPTRTLEEKANVQFLNLILNRKKLLRRRNERETRQICRDALTHTNLHSVCCRHVYLLW